MSITGLSKRTLWRRIGDGCLSALDAHVRGEKTRVDLDDALLLSDLPIDPGDHALILAADAGDAEAQCDLAIMLLTAHRAMEAVSWLTLAARQFYPDAMCYLGRCYLSGVGVPRDEDKGILWLSQAAAKGHLVAQHLMRLLQGPNSQPLREVPDPTVQDAALDAIERQVILNVLRETADPEKAKTEKFVVDGANIPE